MIAVRDKRPSSYLLRSAFLPLAISSCSSDTPDATGMTEHSKGGELQHRPAFPTKIATKRDAIDNEKLHARCCINLTW